jgi:hypothetical protein
MTTAAMALVLIGAFGIGALVGSLGTIFLLFYPDDEE